MNIINIFMLVNSLVILFFSVRRSYITYIVSIINIAIYGILSIKNGFVLEGLVNLILFLPIFLIGVIKWRNNSSNGIRNINKLNIFEWMIYIVAMIVVSLTIRYFFRLTWIGSGHIQPIIISMTFVSELMKMEGYYEHWYIKSSEYCISLYLLIVSQLTGGTNLIELGLIIIQLFLSFYGAYKWKYE
ncbi:MAG: nicotinamide mononucleotide transporter [Clostridium sp.]